ncbi:MAG: hypothetical protein J6S24_10115 [Lentisphaeria bacterium]|nr:hypothetical protein [Lentisphaeria bacterium]
MSIKNIISKLLSGSQPDAEERAELERFDPEKLLSEISDLRARAEAGEREKLSEKERLELDIANISKERDQLKTAHDTMLRRNHLRELSAKSNFSDPDYLDFLAGKEELDLADAAACDNFIEKLRREKPEAFSSTLKSGSGSGNTPGFYDRSPLVHEDQISRIISELENAGYRA